MLELGSYKTHSQYAVIGRPQEFYIYIREATNSGSASKWLKGAEAFKLYNKFRKIKDKQEFIALAKQVHKEFTV